jgi:iron complex transport system substrate-binding protein
MVEICYELGLEDSIVGWSQYTDYPPEVAEKKGWIPYGDYIFESVEAELAKDVAVVSSFSTYNAEIVDALSPTLVLAESSMQLEMFDELKAKGYNALFHSPQTLDDVFAMIQDVGDAAGKSKEAKKLIDGYKSNIEKIRAITKDLPKPSVYLEIAHRTTYGEDSFGPYATGSGTPFDQMMEIAGGVNAFESLQGDYVQLIILI